MRKATEQQRCGSALRDDEAPSRHQLAELEAIYASAPIGLAVVTPGLRFIRLNQRFAELGGIPAAQQIGRTARELFPDYADHLESIAQRVIDTGEAVHDLEIEGELPGRPGVRRAWIAQWLPLKDASGTVVAMNIVAQDVTARKRAERELRENVEELAAVLDAVPAAVFVAHDPDCRAMSGNRACLELLRLPPGANTSKSAGDDAPPNFRALRNGVELAPEELPVQRAAATGEDISGFELELEFDDRDRMHIYGHARPLFDATGKPRGAVGAFVDVSDVVDARDKSTARMRSAFESDYQYQGMMTTDGILLDANAVSLAGIEAQLEDVVGKPFWETPWFTGTPGMPDQVRAAVPLVAAGQSIRQEIVVNLPTGRRAFDFAMRPVRNAAGDVIAIVPEAVELTERRAAEEQLRQIQKMEAIGQLTGGIAHDFNNLLTGIGGSVELIGLRTAQGRVGDLDRYILMAQDAVKRATSLTHRLLAFARRQVLEPKPTNINRLVRGMEELIRRTVGPEIAVEVIAPDGLWNTLVDPNQLENALLNLCINARDAMPHGGRLTIATANRWLDAHPEQASGLADGEYVSLAVTDSGTGMTHDVMTRAFDPFFTTKPAGQGTGLGLSMIYGFAQQSGGQATIRSQLGRGTTVTIDLPRHFGVEDGADTRSVARDMPRARAGETVLIVDDEPSVRLLISELLNDLGYGVIDAEDGATGLRILQSDANVDLLITDLRMPRGMTGRQLADIGRSLRPGLKVLFISGYQENHAPRDAHPMPGMHLLVKPFAIDVLARRVKAILTEQ